MPGRARPAVLGAVVALAVGVAVVGLVMARSGSAPDPPGSAQVEVVVADAAFPVGLAALADGGFRYGERRTGRVREVTAEGRLLADPVAVVAVRASPGQRGLLGLAVDRRGRTFAAWTRAGDGRLVVGQVAPGPVRLVWRGPPSTDLANGGHLVAAPDGSLVLGVGDLQEPSRRDDPDAPNGKLLALDPDGPAEQRARPRSSGWNNPFAFTFLPDGSLWVADNAPGRRPERLGRGDRAWPRVELEGRRAPAALVALGPGRLGVCGVLDPVLRAVEVGEAERGRPARPGRPLAAPCSVGAVVLADGRVVLATEDRLGVWSPGR